MFYDSIFQLQGRRPRGTSRFLLAGWAAMFVLLILAPSLVDRLVWFPSRESFSVTGVLLLPVVWGTSAAVQIVGLLLAFALFWFFGDDVEFRLGRRRFLVYLGITAAAGFFVSYAWARLFSGHAASIAPYLSWALAFASCRLHAGQQLAWRRYALGSFSMLTWILLGALALGILLDTAGPEPLDQSMGALATVGAGAFWFDPRWLRRLWVRWKKHRGFGKRNGMWGY